MGKRKAVKAHFTDSEIQMLERLCRLTGESKGSVLRMAFMNYAKDIGLLNEKVLQTLETAK